MRSETEMMELILEGARQDQRVLAAYLKGSRTNPNVPKDPYRDFDVMYVVTETESFRRDTRWLDRFGTILLKQEQGDELGFGERFGLRDCFDQLYSWLLIFGDGNRIDIGVETVEHMERGATRNKLFLPLLDKVGCLPKLPPPSDEDFHVKVPAEKRYLGCCTAFFSNICRRNCTRPSLTPMPPVAFRCLRTASTVPGSSSARRPCWWPSGCPFPIRTGWRRAFCGTSS